MRPSNVRKNEMSRNPAKAGRRTSKFCAADIGVTTNSPLFPVRMDTQSHLFADIRSILEAGMDPQELADRLGKIIDVIVADMKNKKNLGDLRDAIKSQCIDLNLVEFPDDHLI